jgi:hypothetical protein
LLITNFGRPGGLRVFVTTTYDFGG